MDQPSWNRLNRLGQTGRTGPHWIDGPNLVTPGQSTRSTRVKLTQEGSGGVLTRTNRFDPDGDMREFYDDVIGSYYLKKKWNKIKQKWRVIDTRAGGQRLLGRSACRCVLVSIQRVASFCSACLGVVCLISSPRALEARGEVSVVFGFPNLQNFPMRVRGVSVVFGSQIFKIFSVMLNLICVY